jgi:NADH-quinone oxidoreductase subunit N
MWTPDVYEGSPTADHGVLCHRAQGGGHGAVRPRVHDAFGGAVGDWQQIVAFLSVLSMFLGAIAAIGQTDIKRLMAYSSIAHMGFALMGLAAGTAQGVQAMLIYMAIYVTMNIGTFAFILTMEKDGRHITDISALSMFRQPDRRKALALLVLMFSLAGVPPLVGFFGKYALLLRPSMRAWHGWPWPV